MLQLFFAKNPELEKCFIEFNEIKEYIIDPNKRCFFKQLLNSNSKNRQLMNIELMKLKALIKNFFMKILSFFYQETQNN